MLCKKESLVYNTTAGNKYSFNTGVISGALSIHTKRQVGTMADISHLSPRPGVGLTCLRSRKFKTNVLSVSLLRPLTREHAAPHALLPQVLSRGNSTYPDARRLSAALDALYGARLEPFCRKKGETQCIGFLSLFNDERFLPGKTNVCEAITDLLVGTLLAPAGPGNAFVPEYFEQERVLLRDRIRAGMNDKAEYAKRRLLETMCAEEAYGVDALGDEHTLENLTAETLWSLYQSILPSSRVEFLYVGARDPKEIEALLRDRLSILPRALTFDPVSTQVVRQAETLKQAEDTMDITQGKLLLGMRLGVTSLDDAYPAALLATAVFGGSTTSKLFMNIRERLSLCYYASAWMESLKGLLLVSSGIEPEKRDEVQKEIFSEWDAVSRGDFTAEEFDAARDSLVQMLSVLGDSPHRLEDHYLGQAVSGQWETPEALVERLRRVSPAEVAAVASGGSWDTAYFLRGVERA